MTGAASWRRIKKHRTYTYQEAAAAIDVDKRTVRNWVGRDGLSALRTQRPHLIVGDDLIAFLRSRSAQRKTPLTIARFYCLRCRDARPPAMNMVDCNLAGRGAAALTALCGVCETTMNKRLAKDKIAELRHVVDLQTTQDATTLKRRA